MRLRSPNAFFQTLFTHFSLSGDQVLEVDGFSLRDCTHEDAIRVLRQTSQNVKLKVLRDEIPLREEDVYEVIQVELVKKVGKVSLV